jgi:hypothetical protein
MICLNQFDQIMSSHRKIANLENTIHLIRGQRVMLDSDLAAIYFAFTREEFTNLISQNAISRSHGGRRTLPVAFTEHGAIMLASVLNSEIAVQASVRIVRAFIRLREMVAANVQLAAKPKELERRFDSHDERIANLFATLKQLLEPSEAPKRREIGFHVREEAVRYRVRKAPRIKNRNSRIS